MRTEPLRLTPEVRIARTGRFLIAELLVPHRVLSTSVRQGGQTEGVRFIVNHQSCEGADHRERLACVHDLGLEGYHDLACSEAQLDPDYVVLMGTAANMNYAAIEEAAHDELSVIAVVTAGVQGNAACAGDPAHWLETGDGWRKLTPYGGTINTMLFVNRSLTAGALARAALTMAEAKSAALARLAVRSRYSPDAATGTGTDQFAIAAPLDAGKALTSTNPHSKLGELIGVAVREATLEAVRWQNGLEPSYTRNLFHALGAHGLHEASFFDDIAPHLTERELELLKRNSKPVFYEPMVAAAAYAIAALLDRIRYGTLPPGATAEALRQQLALLAANLAAQPQRFAEFCGRLDNVDPAHPIPALLAAIALGWSSKWK